MRCLLFSSSFLTHTETGERSFCRNIAVKRLHCGDVSLFFRRVGVAAEICIVSFAFTMALLLYSTRSLTRPRRVSFVRRVELLCQTQPFQIDEQLRYERLILCRVREYVRAYVRTSNNRTYQVIPKLVVACFEIDQVAI